MHERFRYKSREELTKKAVDLGLALPFSDDISPLFLPAMVEGRRISNRLVVQPMEGYDSNPDGSPSALTERRYLRYAKGGSGIIWFEALAVSPEGRSNPGQLWINNENYKSFRELNDKIRNAASGTGNKPLLVIQLTHSGRYSKPDSSPAPLAAAPNPALDRTTPHILSDRELEIIGYRYIEAAKCAAEAGFDAVDIKACHGYLVIDLLASAFRKNSIYGGDSLEARSRFFLETIDRVKKEIPGIMVTTRLNMSDLYQGGFGVNDNNEADFSEALALVGELKKKNISLVNLSMGSPYHNPHVTRPYDTPVPGQQVPSEHPLEGVMNMINGTALFQKKFPDISFVGSAYSWLRQYAPNVGAEVIRRGDASFIGFGRMSFAYPSLPEDLKKNGKADPAKVCIACSGCTRLIRNLRPGGCVIRDKEIYGKELRKLIADGK